MHTDIENNRTVNLNQFIPGIKRVTFFIEPDTTIVALGSIDKMNATTNFWRTCGIKRVVLWKENVAWIILRRKFDFDARA